VLLNSRLPRAARRASLEGSGRAAAARREFNRHFLNRKKRSGRAPTLLLSTQANFHLNSFANLKSPPRRDLESGAADRPGRAMSDLGKTMSDAEEKGTAAVTAVQVGGERSRSERKSLKTARKGNNQPCVAQKGCRCDDRSQPCQAFVLRLFANESAASCLEAADLFGFKQAVRDSACIINV
jgi:hypothetical protein